MIRSIRGKDVPLLDVGYFRFQFLTKTSATLTFHLFVMAEETSFKFSFIFWNWETFTKWNYFAEAGTTPLSSKRLIMNIGIKFRCSVGSVFGMRTIQKNINAGVRRLGSCGGWRTGLLQSQKFIFWSATWELQLKSRGASPWIPLHFRSWRSDHN